MARTLSVGEEAPNFDLSSTEDVLLMLKDEVSRHSVLLYFLRDPESERGRSDLRALAALQPRLERLGGKILVISDAPMPKLKELQRELHLLFPLLRDDRGLSRDYGVVTPQEGEEAPPVLVLVGRRQEVLWLASPAPPVEEAREAVEQVLKRLPTPTDNYPRSVINRLVDRWVN